jgi:long-chain-fatty-acid--CoA ligase ACSBG
VTTVKHVSLSASIQASSSLPPAAPSAEALDPKNHTISELFFNTVKRLGNQTALRAIKPQEMPVEPSAPYDKKFLVKSYSWDEYANKAKKFARALIAQNVNPQDVVTIQGSNSPEWFFANLGTVLAGGIAAGVYPTNGKELCEHIAKTTEAKVAFVEDEAQLKKYEGLKSTALKCVVVWNKVKKPQNFPVPVLSMEEFLRKGKKVSNRTLESRMNKQTSKDPCALVYTSGTTGNPKAAVLTQENLTFTGSLAAKKFSINQDHRGLSYLPLSHIAPLQMDYITPMMYGQTIDIAPSDSIKGSNLRQHMVNTKPTYFLGVPRVWEKFKEGIEAKLKTASFFKKRLFQFCSLIGRKIVPDYNFLTSKKDASGLSLLQRIRFAFDRAILSLLDKKIYTPIKAALGLDCCKIAASGAGALDPKVRSFFDGLNIHIIDLYGMSETSALVTLPDGPTPQGSCGKHLPGAEIKILNPDENGEGEILTKGPNIFSGYLKDEDATQDALDSEQFLHTGDMGKLDKEGNLFITGRIKEIIKTSGGENIPPLKIEDKIKVQLPIVSQATVIGNQRNFLTCLLTLKTEIDKQGNPTDKLAPDVIAALRKINSTATTLKEAAKDEKVQQFLMKGIQRANQQADSHAQHVQKITILPEDFSVANGMMTPTLKLRRTMIEKKYQAEIDKMYAAAV